MRLVQTFNGCGFCKVCVSDASAASISLGAILSGRAQILLRNPQATRTQAGQAAAGRLWVMNKGWFLPLTGLPSVESTTSLFLPMSKPSWTVSQARSAPIRSSRPAAAPHHLSHLRYLAEVAASLRRLPALKRTLDKTRAPPRRRHEPAARRNSPWRPSRVRHQGTRAATKARRLPLPRRPSQGTAHVA